MELFSRQGGSELKPCEAAVVKEAKYGHAAWWPWGTATPASPAAITSAFLIEADQTLTAAACPQMSRRRTEGKRQRKATFGQLQLFSAIQGKILFAVVGAA